MNSPLAVTALIGRVLMLFSLLMRWRSTTRRNMPSAWPSP
jgi:hypothetical protein